MTRGRLEAFSDGVIAIIITITILIIDLPQGNDMAALLSVLPLVVAIVPWIIPDLRMKRVFEVNKRMQSKSD